MENIADSFISKTGIKIKDSSFAYANELNDWIGESVIDFEKKDLNPNLWQGKELKKKVKRQIMDAIGGVMSQADLDTERLTAVMIEGSNLTYYYNRYTDIDIHLYIEDITEDEDGELKEAISEFNKKEETITGTKNVLELYLMDEEQLNRLNGPRYDLLKDKWLADPKRVDVPADMYKAAVEISLTFARDLDLAVGELKRDVIEYVALDEEIEDMLHVDIQKLKQVKRFKVDEIKADLEALAIKHQNIKDMRRRAFSEEYVQKEETLYYIKAADADRSYTLYNIIFKILQRFGYVDPLKMFKYDVYNEALEKRDFDDNTDMYLRRIVKILGLFNKINLTERDLEDEA